MNTIISKGNMKLGKIPNISLPPILSCGNKVECAKSCYALKAFRLYPSAKKAWLNNLDLYNSDPNKYFGDIDGYLLKSKPAFFRFHQAGDILNQDYLNRMKVLCRKHKNVKFLCFTKKYNLDFRYKSSNLEIVFSAWPGRNIPKSKFRIAWLDNGEDNRIPKSAIECPGHCDVCGMCWNLSKLNKDVKFKIH